MSHHILNRYLKFIIRRIHVMKKIAIIIQALRGGGAERTAANMSIDLSSAFEVHLIVFVYTDWIFHQEKAITTKS